MRQAFRDKATIIITGGAAGLGRALGRELAAQGATVLLLDIDGALAEETAVAIRATGGRGE